ncbi:MAG: methyltransferase domain-containing protein [Candidatus Obscuribacterales bacterium]|nr:methyltransferase domain-containing protein [Candidatus Obscuribacterales bacterium]
MDPSIVVEFLQPTESMRVLDAASGRGDTALTLAPHVSEVVAVDSSTNAIEKCRDKIKDSQVNNVQALVMPVESLLFPDEDFDAVTCRFATHHFDDIPMALQEMCRVLKRDGVMIIVDRVVPDVSEYRHFIEKIGRLRDSTFTTVHTLDEWREMCAVAGLKIVRTREAKESTDISKWLGHSPLSEREKELIYEAFEQASPNVQSYFKIHYEREKPAFFIDDKMVMRILRV